MAALAPATLLAISAGTAAVGTGISAYSAVAAGEARAGAAAFEQRQLQIQEQTTRTAAAQAEAKRREQLTSSLETIQAIRAGRGVGSFSPTGMAIFDSITEDSDRDVAIERANYLTAAERSATAATMAGRKAQTSLLAGYLGGAEAITSGAFKTASIYGRRA